MPFGKTADGFETQFGTNHLGHFVPVNRIASLIKRGGRLVNLSSAGHQIADVDLEDPNFQRTAYDPWAAYGRSKTANILFAVEFDRRHRGNGIRAAAVHPGSIRTERGRHMNEDVQRGFAEILAQLERLPGSKPMVYKSVAQAPRPRSGPRRSRRPTPSAGATARIVTSPTSSTRPASPSLACAPTRSMPRRPRRCGRRARSWSASASPEPGAHYEGFVK